MSAQGWGRVVSVSPSAVREPIPHVTLSSARRPGLLAAFKTLAHHLAPDGITFNTLLTGLIDADHVRETGVSPEGVPAGRMGTIEEYGASPPSCAPSRLGTPRARASASTAA